MNFILANTAVRGQAEDTLDEYAQLLPINARSASPSSGGVSTLYHEVLVSSYIRFRCQDERTDGYDAVEDDAVVVSALC